tara:strand:+ start:318 stop:593 length:276 start_codon:yes stop_codon:yes gene_type:complete
MGEIAKGVEKIIQPIGQTITGGMNQALGGLGMGQLPGGQMLGQANEQLRSLDPLQKTPLGDMQESGMMGLGGKTPTGSLLTGMNKNKRKRY